MPVDSESYSQKEASCCSKVATTSDLGMPSRVASNDGGLPYNMGVKFRYLLLAVVCLVLSGIALAQDSTPQDSTPQDAPPAPVEKLPTDKNAPPPKNNAASPPRSDNVPAGESSSAQTRIDVSPPKGDEKAHPESGLDSDVNEFTPYNPMKALKDVEVGDYYYKQENYKAAISRYREALEVKPHDAEATYKLAQVLQKTNDYAGAKENYQEYLKMLPNGPYAKKAKEALEKMKKQGLGAGG
jgi:tetratricopeptide (TPR) repeat protein